MGMHDGPIQCGKLGDFSLRESQGPVGREKWKVVGSAQGQVWCVQRTEARPSSWASDLCCCTGFQT